MDILIVRVKKPLFFILVMLLSSSFIISAGCASQSLELEAELVDSNAQALENFEAVAPAELQSIIRSSEYLMEAAIYAYMDIDVASPDMRETILEARDVIIHCTDWVNDDLAGTVYTIEIDENGNEIRCDFPSFSSLFPGWEIPVRKPDTTQSEVNLDAGSRAIYSTRGNWIERWNINKWF